MVADDFLRDLQIAGGGAHAYLPPRRADPADPDLAGDRRLLARRHGRGRSRRTRDARAARPRKPPASCRRYDLDVAYRHHIRWHLPPPVARGESERARKIASGRPNGRPARSTISRKDTTVQVAASYQTRVINGSQLERDCAGVMLPWSSYIRARLPFGPPAGRRSRWIRKSPGFWALRLR